MQPEPVSLLNRLMEPVTSTAGERFRTEVVAGLIRPIQPNPPGTNTRMRTHLGSGVHGRVSRGTE